MKKIVTLLFAAALLSGCVEQPRMPQFENSKFVGQVSHAATLKAKNTGTGVTSEVLAQVDQAGSVGMTFPAQSFVFNSEQKQNLSKLVDKYEGWCEIAKRERVDVAKSGGQGTDVMMWKSLQPVIAWNVTPMFFASNEGQTCELGFILVETKFNNSDPRYNSYIAYHTGQRATEVNRHEYRLPDADARTLVDVFHNPDKFVTAQQEKNQRENDLFK